MATAAKKKAPAAGKTLKVTLTQSRIGQKEINLRTLDSLGLRKVNQTVTHTDSPQIRGMIAKCAYMLKVEESN